jgi:hypothetical protein
MAVKKETKKEAVKEVLKDETVEVSLVNHNGENQGVYVVGLYIEFVDGKAKVTSDVAKALKDLGLV